MRRVNGFYCCVVCALTLCLAACEKENQLVDDEIPVAIKSDLSRRSPLSEITTFQDYQDGLSRIDLIDNLRNKASIWYQNQAWKMTHTETQGFGQLPFDVQYAFVGLGYKHAKIINIYKTERDGMGESLYTIYFKYRWKNVENVEHYVFINEDGLYLETFNWPPNDPTCFIDLPEDHFRFIAEKYKNAEIRGYVNNAGAHEYFILHGDTIKYVLFRGTDASERYFWKETKYELDKQAEIPANVMSVLKGEHPEFVYTHVYYIESEEGNWYHFIDRNSDNDLGYCLSENIKPAAVFQE